MKVAFVRPSTAFLPEIDAYVAALTKAGIECLVAPTEFAPDVAREVDLVYRFGGLLRPIPGSNTPEVHEYASASTGRFPRSKNLIKARTGGTPIGRVFLNEFVCRQFSFAKETPFIYRDMGVPEPFLNCAQPSTEEFDLVYVGAISGRRGLLRELERLSALNITILVAGSSTSRGAENLRRLNGVTYLGPVAHSDVPRILARARAGLNYVPECYPYTEQTATKVLEYLVAGLPVVSNSTKWLRRHASIHGYSTIPLKGLTRSTDLFSRRTQTTPSPWQSVFLWNNILEQCKFADFVRLSV